MAENRISYLDKNYEDFRSDMLDIVKRYYPEISDTFDDASIGQWLIDLVADIGDNLSYATDRALQETNIDSAQERSSLNNIARTNGVKIPGKKAAKVEVALSCIVPIKPSSEGDLRLADERYAPLVRRGTLFSNGSQTFELMEDMNFAEQFDSNGQSNREIVPNRDSNGIIQNYTYRKLGIALAGQSKIYKQIITSDMIEPFMTITLEDDSVLNVESIIVKDGTDLVTDPPISEFYVDKEFYKDKSDKPVNRYFEVDSLADQYRYGYECEKGFDSNGNLAYYNPVWNGIRSDDGTIYRKVVRGKWERLKNKYITEYTDNGQLSIIFGAGIRNEYGSIPDSGEDFTRYMMSRMEANDYMGVLPEVNHTMFILYRVGGGEASNIAQNTLTNIIYYNITIDGDCSDEQDAYKKTNVRDSLTVTNTTPSYGGKDEPTEDELRYLIKYNTSAQNRCVTVHDYESKIISLPAKYGTPFRVGVVEENNKICIYTLGLDENGHLSNKLAETVANNIKDYLSEYKMINDFVEIRSGKVINLNFTVNVFIDKTYEKSDVVKNIIDKVYDYMDIKKHVMGEDIFLGDLSKEISKLDGVINLISIKVYNQVGDNYSSDQITQTLVSPNDCSTDDCDDISGSYNRQIDLNDSDQVLYGDSISMFEIKNKNTDITVNVKQR